MSDRKSNKMLAIIIATRAMMESLKYQIHNVNDFERVLEHQEPSDYIQGKMDALEELQEIFSDDERIELELEMLSEHNAEFIQMMNDFPVIIE